MRAEWFFEIKEVHLKKFQKPIRNKVQVLKIMMEAIKIILSASSNKTQLGGNYMVLKIDKASRLYFILENKIFSISFPFVISESDESYQIFSSSECFEHEIDNNVTSNVLACLNSIEESQVACSIDFAAILEEESTNLDLFPFIKELLFVEDGYIRYDYDEKNHESAKKKGNPHLHPLNHLDIFYTNSNTFKIGLGDKIDYSAFDNILDADTSCLYLQRK